MKQTLFDKVWDAHRIRSLAPGVDLLAVDRHLYIDLHALLFADLEKLGRGVRNPEMTFAVPDHVVSSAPGRTGGNAEWSERYISALRRAAKKYGIRLFDVNDDGQGIVHVIGPELGLTQPGILLLCGDSHTSTHGGLGALSWGIGASEVMHVLATQTIVQRRPKRMRVNIEGRLPAGVEPKDVILRLIGQIGAAGGTGYAIEYAGSAMQRMEIEGRLTICNLSIELGAKTGMVAPDDKAIEFVRGRPFAPNGKDWDRAVGEWRSLTSDPDATFDREVDLDVMKLVPQITWGTSPQDVIGIDEMIPHPDAAADPDRKRAMQAGLDYMGLQAGRPLAGTPIDWVFIGSCTNSRISDLRSAAAVAKGRKVSPKVKAWVVPGSKSVKRQAEAEGLDKIFLQAGFEWREPGCSLCVGANGETLGDGERSVSTSNRNFVGRQGPGARTHLASPPMAVAAAIAGRITDVRTL
ncbi:MAG: 3-isopropylmalate dehydratase large subunit [Betaproteobacteria bacterium]|nr:3-isopropylmalate dehydratase large subunit [Betaproteobacteria bacterium]